MTWLANLYNLIHTLLVKWAKSRNKLELSSYVILEYCSLFPYFCSSDLPLLLFKFKIFVTWLGLVYYTSSSLVTHKIRILPKVSSLSWHVGGQLNVEKEKQWRMKYLKMVQWINLNWNNGSAVAHQYSLLWEKLDHSSHC